MDGWGIDDFGLSPWGGVTEEETFVQSGWLEGDMLIRKDTQIRMPVRLVGTDGLGVTGILPTNITDGTTVGNATITKSDGTLASIVLTNGVNWFEISASKSPGLYHVTVPSSAPSVLGPLELTVLATASQFLPAVSVATVETVATSADIASKISKNKWQIFTSGLNANRLVIYDDDGTTILYKFDLKDSAGVATTTTPYSRTPV